MESNKGRKRVLRSSTKKKKKRIKKAQKPLAESTKPKRVSRPKKIKTTLKRLEKKKAKQTRIMTMRRDAERYALVELHKNKKGFDEFVLMNLKVNKTRKVSISPQNEVNCSCIDFKIRCKKMKISCKHILYVLDRIMKLDMDTVANLKIKNAHSFYEVFDRIKGKYFSDLNNMFKLSKDKEIAEDDVCPICYTEFVVDGDSSNQLQCPDCRNLVHRDCMRLWLANASRKTCVYCRSSKWSELKL